MRSMNLLFNITATIAAIWHAFRECFAKERAKRARFNAALAFNKIHTYTWQSKGQWMCPTCNRVHLLCGTSPFSGLQFPECCEFPQGHRLDRAFATGVK